MCVELFLDTRLSCAFHHNTEPDTCCSKRRSSEKTHTHTYKWSRNHSKATLFNFSHIPHRVISALVWASGIAARQPQTKDGDYRRELCVTRCNRLIRYRWHGCISHQATMACGSWCGVHGLGASIEGLYRWCHSHTRTFLLFRMGNGIILTCTS